jgi:hypothetical protein
MIVRRNQGVSLRFNSSLQFQSIMGKECLLYEILALNEKGEAKGLENLPIVQELQTFFQKSYPVYRPKESWSLQ